MPKVKRVHIQIYADEDDALWWKRLLKNGTIRVKSAGLFKILLDSAAKRGAIAKREP